MTVTKELTATDRCDRDQSERAVVIVEKDSRYHGHMELQLCSHHFEDNRKNLELSGWSVTVDERSA